MFTWACFELWIPWSFIPNLKYLMNSFPFSINHGTLVILQFRNIFNGIYATLTNAVPPHHKFPPQFWKSSGEFTTYPKSYAIYSMSAGSLASISLVTRIDKAVFDWHGLLRIFAYFLLNYKTYYLHYSLTLQQQSIYGPGIWTWKKKTKTLGFRIRVTKLQIAYQKSIAHPIGHSLLSTKSSRSSSIIYVLLEQPTVGHLW